MTEFKKVTGCKPCGSQVLIELLTSQEILQTKLYVNNKKLASEYQAVVLAVGPSLKENISNNEIENLIWYAYQGLCDRPRNDFTCPQWHDGGVTQRQFNWHLLSLLL